jgi:hypothetical protein
MKRTEFLEAASQRLEEAVLLLTAAGEDRLAADVEELAEWVDFSTPPFEGKLPSRRLTH